MSSRVKYFKPQYFDDPTRRHQYLLYATYTNHHSTGRLLKFRRVHMLDIDRHLADYKYYGTHGVYPVFVKRDFEDEIVYDSMNGRSMVLYEKVR